MQLVTALQAPPKSTASAFFLFCSFFHFFRSIPIPLQMRFLTEVLDGPVWYTPPLVEVGVKGDENQGCKADTYGDWGAGAKLIIVNKAIAVIT
jgi:hypothetical protein